MDVVTADGGPDPRLLQALLERVWGKETLLHFRFERFEVAFGDLKVELDGDLRIKVVLGDRSRPPEAGGGSL